MIESELCLSVETLDQLSGGELPPATVRAIETHVDNCEHCRQLLAAVESDSQWQDEICPILRTREDLLFRSTDQPDEDHETQSLASVLQLLGPTDDPHMLGRIGEYEVVSVIGRGGMGVVFKAFDARLNRFVAIKMLLPHLAASGAARKRFAREGRAAAAVIDDNVMPIYNVDQWQGTPYLVTQYSRGLTLQQRIQKQGPLEAKEVLRIAMQTARGLEAAHAQGLVHRDVKPSNILLDGTVERAMLTDFGLARAVDDASITRTGTLAGTPQFMSPEQARGDNVDARSDLFGLGCVMYVMCTGRPPFRADNSYAILRLIADEDPRPIQEINADIPAWLGTLVSKLMSKQAEDRYANAAEVAELCEACLAHIQQPTAVKLPTALVQPKNAVASFFSNGKRVLFLVAAVFGFAVFGMMLWQATNPKEIDGSWRGPDWGEVVLTATQAGQYEGTFTRPFGKEKGTIDLNWSRLERRFNGSWREGENISGTVSLHLVGDEVRGAWTTNEASLPKSGTPKLAELIWKRSDRNGNAQAEGDLVMSLRAFEVKQVPNTNTFIVCSPDQRVLSEHRFPDHLKVRLVTLDDDPIDIEQYASKVSNAVVAFNLSGGLIKQMVAIDTKGRFRTFDLEKPITKKMQCMLNGRSVIYYIADGAIYAFSGRTGTWDSLKAPTIPDVRWENGTGIPPAIELGFDTETTDGLRVAVPQGTAIFHPDHGHWEINKTKYKLEPIRFKIQESVKGPKALQRTRTESQEYEQLLGTWTLTEQTIGGKPNPITFKRREITFSKNEENSGFSVQNYWETDSDSSDLPAQIFRLTIAPNESPMEMNWFGKGILVQSIYELDGDTLRIAIFGRSEYSRPDSFGDVDSGDGTVLLVWSFKRKDDIAITPKANAEPNKAIDPPSTN